MKLPFRPTSPKLSHGATGRAEFESCLERDFPALVGQLYTITLNARAAREHVQDAYAEAWRQWPTIRDLPDPASWVRTAAIGYSRVWVRHAGQRARGEPEGPWPPTSPASRALFDALGTSSEDGRRSLVLYHVVGLPVDVIANIEQVAVSQVHAALARTHDHLLGGLREAREAAARGGSDAERLVAACTWDEDKTAALQSLVAELASSVVTPAMSTVVRRAGSQNRATSAAAIAVLAVGALGGVTIAASAVGEPTTEGPSGAAVGAATIAPPGPTLIPAEPVMSPTATRTRRPIARPRPTVTRILVTTTPTTTTATSETTPTTSTGTSAPTTTTSADAR